MIRSLLALAAIPCLSAASPTFTKDVAPIFYRHCVGCHHPNDIAPMSLVDFQSARPWAKSIREAVLTRKMPPWFADARFEKFANDARLSAAELATIQAWVDQGAVEGDRRDLPKPPVFTDGWKLGAPDRIVDIGEDHTVTPGNDAYEHFIVPTNFPAGIWIRAAEIRPGNRRVVHHVHVNLVQDAGQAGPTTVEGMKGLSDYLVREDKLTRVRADAPVLDNACAADAPDLPYVHGFQEGALASFLPGRPPDVFAEGTAKWAPPGARLEFVVHYARISGGPQTDRTSVGFYLAPGPPERVLRRMDLRNFFFQIPPGAAAHEVRRCYTFERDKLLLSITPHMHYRGKDVRYDLVRPDGARQTLLYVPRYDFNWQLVYRFQDPVRVEKGSLLEVTAHYDNSPNNPANPDSSKPVRWGDRSEEEMMTSWIEYLDAERGKLAREYR
jgi:hypothetical protein